MRANEATRLKAQLKVEAAEVSKLKQQLKGLDQKFTAKVPPPAAAESATASTLKKRLSADLLEAQTELAATPTQKTPARITSRPTQKKRAYKQRSQRKERA